MEIASVLLNRFFKILGHTYQKVFGVYKYLLAHEKLLLVCLFTFTLVYNVPGILLLSTQNEPCSDGAYYYDEAKNILNGNGEVVYIKGIFFDDWEEHKGEVETPSMSGPAYPYFVAFIISISDSLLAIRIANTIISAFTVVIYFLLVKNLVNKKIAFLSSLILVFNPLYYMKGVALVTEPLFLFVFLLSFYFLLGTREGISNNRNLILAGVFSGLAFLTRYVGLFLIVAVVIWLLFPRKKYKESFIYGLSSSAVILPWFFNNKMTTGYFFPYRHINTMGLYPTSGTGGGGISFSPIGMFFLRGFNIYVFSVEISSILLFSILFPFILIGILKYIQDKNLSLFILFSGFTLLYHFNHYTTRYMLPLVPLLVPIGLMVMNDFVKQLGKISFFTVSLKPKHVLSFMLGLLFILSAVSTPFYLKEGYIDPYYQNNEAKYAWLEDNALDDSVMFCSEPRHARFFTGLEVVRLFYNLNETTFAELIEEYNASFVVVEEKDSGRYNGNELLSELYRNYTLGHSMGVGKYRIVLRHIEDDSKNAILFYGVETIQG